MAVFLRRPGSAKLALVAPAVAEFQSPFKESFHDPVALQAFRDYDAQQSAQPAPEPVDQPTEALLRRPAKKIIKLTGGKPIPRPKQVGEHDAAEAGFAASKATYPDTWVGARVKITNSLFPWVLHYTPGDICKVEAIAPYLNASHEDPVKYRIHTLLVLESVNAKNKGNRITMFRHEFILLDPDATPMPKGRVTVIK